MKGRFWPPINPPADDYLTLVECLSGPARW